LKGNFHILLIGCLLLLAACKHEPSPQVPGTPVADNYPEAVKNIIVNKCATAGCHNEASYTGAGGLRLDSRQYLFDGGNNGAVVVPYNTDNSSLLYFINTFPELGPTAQPTMPYNLPSLSREDYETLRDWIQSGAPDKAGNIPFHTEAATRQKIYTVQQGCDLVGVIDAEKSVVMRYISVGKTHDREQPNNIVISPDGRYAYVSFWNASLIQKIDTRADSVIAEVATPRAFQKAIQLNEDGTRLIACNWYTQDLLLIDAVNMNIISNMGQAIRFIGGFAAAPGNVFYATSQFGNTVYKIQADGNHSTISIDNKAPVQETAAGTPDPYRIIMSPDKSTYFVTCTHTGEVRMMNSATDQLIKTIPVGNNPQEMAISTSEPYLFVSCMNDTISALEVGSVYVINYNTGNIVKKITGKFFQPYAMAADDKNGTLYIFSRNEDRNGPPPHHSGPCSGRNGFYQVYNIHTLTPINGKRYEISVDPYGAAARFSF
jgi:DNA-binding beta-propeller fold protein YncE